MAGCQAEVSGTSSIDGIFQLPRDLRAKRGMECGDPAPFCTFALVQATFCGRPDGSSRNRTSSPQQNLRLWPRSISLE